MLCLHVETNLICSGHEKIEEMVVRCDMFRAYLRGKKASFAIQFALLVSWRLVQELE